MNDSHRTANYRSRLLGLLSIGLIGLIGGCGKGGSDEVSGEPVDMSQVEQRSLTADEPIADNGLDVSLASDLFFAAVVIHPQQVFESEVISPEDLKLIMGELTAKTGLPLERCRRVTVLIPLITNAEQTPAPVMTMEFAEPVDLADCLTTLDVPLQTKEVGEQTMFYDPKAAIAAYQVSDGRIVMGGMVFVEPFAEGQLPRTGRLAELMGELALSGDVEGVVNGAAMESMRAGMPGGGNSGEGPGEMFFSMSLTDDQMAKMNFDAPNEDQAKELQGQMEQSKNMFKLLGPTLIQTAAANAPAPKRTLLTTFVKDLIAGTRIETDDRKVTISVTRPDNLGPAISVFAELARQEMDWSKRDARFEKASKAMLAYHGEHQSYPLPGALDDPSDGSGLSWRVHVLPQLGHQELYDQFNLEESWDSEHNIALLDQMPEVYQTIDSTNETTMSLLEGEGAAFLADRAIDNAFIADGRTKTIMLIDRGPDSASPWTKPDQWKYDPESGLPDFGNLKESFFVATLFDGTVHRVPRRTRERDLRGMISANGEEDINVERVLGIQQPGAGMRPSFGF